MPKYSLSPNAACSIADINTYTIDRFGVRQTQRYLEKLRVRFECLTENPQIGM